MSDVGKFIGGFGESFVKTLQTERERAQRQQQFNQEMAFKTRQFNLLSQVQQKKLQMEMNEPYETKTGDIYGRDEGLVNFNKPLWEMPLAPPKPQTFDIEGSFKNSETGTYWTFDKNTGEPRDLQIPYDKNEGRSTTNINMDKTTEPYVATKDLDTAWNEYKRLDEMDKNWKNLSKKQKEDKDGKEISYETFKKVKQAKLKEIEIETKDRAKKLSEVYSGFNQMFNDFLRDPDYKNASDKDAYISKEMFGYPSEAIRQMKDLLSKRIFE